MAFAMRAGGISPKPPPARGGDMKAASLLRTSIDCERKPPKMPSENMGVVGVDGFRKGSAMNGSALL